MSVFRNEQRGGRWVYDFWAKGERYRGYCIDPLTGEEAKSGARARDVEAHFKRVARARYGMEAAGNRPGAFTLAQALLMHAKSQARSSRAHVSNIGLYSRELLAFFGASTPVVEITKARVDDYRQFCLEQPLKIWKGGASKKRSRLDPRWWGTSSKTRSAASANHYLNCLRAALARAHGARDPATGLPMLPFPPDVDAIPAPKRRPRPMPDAELKTRLEKAPPWVRDAAELARLFGLRRAEALAVTLGNIDREARALAFRGEEVKGDADQHAHGGPAGWELLKRLAAQARARGVEHLVTWPGREHWRAVERGEKPKGLAWVPLKSIRRAWRTTAAGKPGHRFHDVRARYVTEVAKVAPSAVAQEAARHADPATTARYVAIASKEAALAVGRAVRPNMGRLRAVR